VPWHNNVNCKSQQFIINFLKSQVGPHSATCILSHYWRLEVWGRSRDFWNFVHPYLNECSTWSPKGCECYGLLLYHHHHHQCNVSTVALSHLN
jgi:hypothetical protein